MSRVGFIGFACKGVCSCMTRRFRDELDLLYWTNLDVLVTNLTSKCEFRFRFIKSIDM